MNPHAPYEECNKLFENNLIYGCGKPFRIEVSDNIMKVFICDYI
jgi:hypothetical protein